MFRLLRVPESISLALHTMALLGHEPERRFTNEQIATRLGVSGNHLAKVMPRLVRRGLVTSVPGPKGGFRPGSPGEEVTLLEICEAVEGPLEHAGCLLEAPMCDGQGCLLGEKMRSIGHQIHEFLAGTTLAELADGIAVLK